MVLPHVKIAIPLSTTQYTQDFYDVIKEAPDGGWTIGGAPGSMAVLMLRGPFEAMYKQMLYEKNLKMILISAYSAGGSELAEVDALTFFRQMFGHELGEDPLYGKQIIYLGYVNIPNEMVWPSLANDIYSIKIVDYQNIPLSSFPMMQGPDAIKNAREVDFINSFSGELAYSLFPDIPIITINLQPGISMLEWKAGLLTGMVGGTRGGAEYEQLTGYLGSCTENMLVSSAIAVAIIGGLSITTISYFTEKKRAEK